MKLDPDATATENLLDGHGAEARARVDAYYAAADTASRIEQVAGGEDE